MPSSARPKSPGAVGREKSPETGQAGSGRDVLRLVLQRLGSMKITVTLLVLAMFLVVAGTLAQVDKDVWQVVDEYFQSSLAWIDLKIFVPPSFFPGVSVPDQVRLPGDLMLPLGFYFPGGYLIGGLLAVNLVAGASGSRRDGPWWRWGACSRGW